MKYLILRGATPEEVADKLNELEYPVQWGSIILDTTNKENPFWILVQINI